MIRFVFALLGSFWLMMPAGFGQILIPAPPTIPQSFPYPRGNHVYVLRYKETLPPAQTFQSLFVSKSLYERSAYDSWLYSFAPTLSGHDDSLIEGKEVFDVTIEVPRMLGDPIAKDITSCHIGQMIRKGQPTVVPSFLATYRINVDILYEIGETMPIAVINIQAKRTFTALADATVRLTVNNAQEESYGKVEWEESQTVSTMKYDVIDIRPAGFPNPPPPPPGAVEP